MSVVTDRDKGLFPLPGQISMTCSCPDWAVMCKHVAAVLYGVGARLDEAPELLFLLRGVDHEELIGTEVGVAAAAGEARGGRRRISEDALADVFGIEMSEETASIGTKPPLRRKKAASQPNPKNTSRAAAGGAKERQAKTRRVKASAGKAQTPEPRRTAVRKVPGPAPDARPVTAKDVAGLRARFGMSQSEFAKLLGVSAQTVANWEKKIGALGLHARTLAAWNAVKKFTKRQAGKKLSGS